MPKQNITESNITEFNITDGYLPGAKLKQYREKLLKEQNNICPLCEKHINKNEAALDHCHESGRIRQVLHMQCNSFEGVILHKFRRSGVHKFTTIFIFLKNLIAYWLTDYSNNPLHPKEKPKAKKLKKSSYNYLKKVYKSKKIKKKFPDYPKSKKLTKGLEEIYFKLFIDPEYYGEK